MEILPGLLGVAAVKKVMDLIRFIADGDVIQWKAVILTVASWVAGTLLVLVLAGSAYAAELGIEGANLATAVILGIGLGSGASTVHDLAKGGVTIL